MRQWSVPIVFGLGLVLLITALVVNATTVKERQEVEDLDMADVLQQQKEEKEQYLRDSYDKQLEYERIQRQYPALTEQELLELLEVQKLLDPEPIVADEEDSWEALPVDDIAMSDEEFPEIEYSQVQTLLGFLKYGTDVDKNYAKLVEELPAYLSRNLRAEDFWEGDYVRLSSYPLKTNLYVTFLTRLDKTETRIYLTQATESGNGILNLCNLKNSRFMDVVTLDSWVLVNTADPGMTQNALLLLGEKNGSFALLASLKFEGLMTLYKTGDLVTSMGNGVLYDIQVVDGNLLMTAKNGEELFGVKYD